MSFSLPWTVNKLVSTNINNGDAITGGAYGNVSFKVGGKSQLVGNTVIEGNVGIGTAPTTNKLQVSGTIATTSLTTTGGITATATQTINFGTNNPTMGSTNISGVVKTTGAQSVAGVKTFTDQLITSGGISASSAQTINFGTNGPTMSGANIQYQTIPPNSVLGITIDTVNDNTSLGESTGGYSGGANTSVGAYAMQEGVLVTGANNCAYGSSSLLYLISGSLNTACGVRSLETLLNGAGNTCFGYTAGAQLTSQSQNTLIGKGCGSSNTFSNCSGLGADIIFSNGISYGTAIGSGVNCTASNRIQLGRNSDTTVIDGNLTMTNNGITIPRLSTTGVNTTLGSTLNIGNLLQNISYGATSYPRWLSVWQDDGLGTLLDIDTSNNNVALNGKIINITASTGLYISTTTTFTSYSTTFNICPITIKNTSVGDTAVAFYANTSAITINQLKYLSLLNTGIVDLSGTQTINGIKTFATQLLAPTPASTSNSTDVATTAFVYNKIRVDDTLNNQSCGLGSGQFYSSSASNSAYGTYTNQFMTSGVSNVSIGYGASQNHNGSQNVAIGVGAMASSTSQTPTNNVAIGQGALANCATGADGNFALGASSLGSLNIGTNNVMIGYFSGGGVSSGSYNCGVGYGALNTITSGSNNCGIGVGVGGGITTGSSNTFLGNGSNASGDFSNSTAVGQSAQITASNQIVLGTVNESVFLRGCTYLKSCAPIQTGSFTITSSLIYENYPINISATSTVTLPTASLALCGVTIRFRRVAGSGVALNSSASNIRPATSITTSNAVILTASAITSAGNSMTIVCLPLTGSTYAWHDAA